MPEISVIRFEDPLLDPYARLNENQLLNRACPQDGLFIAESPLVIERALDGGCIPVSVLLADSDHTPNTLRILNRLGDLPIYRAPIEVLKQLTGFQLTRGMLCAMRRPKPLSIQALLSGARRIAVLEDVVNPTNLGAIFRSAAALFIDGILLTPSCTDPLYRRCLRVSMGNVFQVPWAYFPKDPNEGTWLTGLKEAGFVTAAMALRENTLSIDDPCLSAIDRLALVLGSEGPGLKDETIAGCDYTVKIPMAEGVDSLNVAAASAVAFWELRKRS